MIQLKKISVRLVKRRMLKRFFHCGNFKIQLNKRTLIIGILNVTPDSFSDGGRYFDLNKAYKRALEIELEGADIIDIGGESTRPGSLKVSLDEELNRVVPLVTRLSKRLKIPISVDTTKFEVARETLKAGASIINDISGLRYDSKIAGLCAEYNAGLILMHMKGSPDVMQKFPRYKDIVNEVRVYLKEAALLAKEAGVKAENIVIDPGIGFGKNLSHNISLIKNLKVLKKLGFPILVGLSRKYFLGIITGLDVGDRLIPTIAANSIAIMNGADIIRVHDVKENILSAKIVDALGWSC